jgi:dipeptidyl aminopeptidase/acylaminoacyl peptidase
MAPTIAFLAAFWLAQQSSGSAPPSAESAEDHRSDMILKAADDVLWHLKLGDIADVDKAVFTSLPLAKEANPTGQNAGNPFIMYAYTFLPKRIDPAKKYPLIVLVHGGVHSNFMSGSAGNSAHIVRELIRQGYVVIAPEYRGSTGYGAGYWRAIDYGGRENDDVWAARNWMIETYGFVDSKRVGIVGWSHGGMIALMNAFEHPEGYAVAYAGVPVSDLVARMGYKTESYRRLFSAGYHIGKDANDNVKEYLARSPVTHAAKLRTPLLIHGATNDEDVNVLEVQRLIAALKAEGKQFESKIYDNPPGGHHFNRIDTKLARDSRAEVYEFLKRYLKP